MKPLIEIITDELKKAFEAAGYGSERVSAKSSDRPDLCEFQSSSAMALAKEAKKAPIIIAGEVAEILKKTGKYCACNDFSSSSADSLGGDFADQYSDPRSDENLSPVRQVSAHAEAQESNQSGNELHKTFSSVRNEKTKNNSRTGVQSSAIFEEVSVAPPGFINLKIDGRFLADYIGQMAQAEKLGVAADTFTLNYGSETQTNLSAMFERNCYVGETGTEALADLSAQTLRGSYDVPSEHEPAAARLSGIECDVAGTPAPKVIIDYGGPNVAKPLHIGHLRSAVIGESIKRIMRFAGYDAIGDVHLGDFGLQMGQIIAELKCRKPDLPYFSADIEKKSDNLAKSKNLEDCLALPGCYDVDFNHNYLDSGSIGRSENIIPEIKEYFVKNPVVDDESSICNEFPKDSSVGGDPTFFGSQNENPSDPDSLSEPPFTLAELEEIYPAASAKCKPASPAYDEKFYEEAKEYTAKLQEGDPACTAIWRHVINVSVADLKKNYEKLNVHFELWNGESDAQPYVKDVVDALKERGLLYESEGALVVDIAEPADKKELPPCLVIKSDGAILYATTDLATIVSRMKNFNPAKIIYVVDKRQELHFTQVFRTAKKGGLVSDETELSFLGFGTMNGTDGKPFKTRDGGVLRLETLIAETEDAVRAKMRASNPKHLGSPDADTSEVADISVEPGQDVSDDTEKVSWDKSQDSEIEKKVFSDTNINSGMSEGDFPKAGYAIDQDNASKVAKVIKADENAEMMSDDVVHKIALAALKYGDLSNQATKDYVFDLNKFTEFEGNTGPYILYTIVRIKSILRKSAEKDVIQLAANTETETDNHSFNSDDAGLDAHLAAGSGNKTYNHSFYSDNCRVEVFPGGLDVKGQNLGANFYVSNIAFTGQPSEKSLLLALSGFAETVRAAAADLAPHKICSYVYDVATSFSGFYHDVRILAEPDINKRASYLALLRVTQRVLETCINLLGFDAPERM